MAQEAILQFLNYRVIQREFGTSVNHYNHIRKNMLHWFFPDNVTVPFISSPFTLDPKAEMEIYNITPLLEQENKNIELRYHGSFHHWTGALLYIASKSRQDMAYTSMILSGYYNCLLQLFIFRNVLSISSSFSSNNIYETITQYRDLSKISFRKWRSGYYTYWLLIILRIISTFGRYLHKRCALTKIDENLMT